MWDLAWEEFQTILQQQWYYIFYLGYAMMKLDSILQSDEEHDPEDLRHQFASLPI